MTDLTTSQTLRAMLVSLRPVIAAREDLPVAEYNRITWLLSVPDDQLIVMARWVEVMYSRFVETMQVIEMENV